MKINYTQRLSVALLLWAVAGSVRADTAVRINSTNDLVRQGDFVKAIENYGEIATTGQSQDEVSYNLGVAQYRHGDIGAAKALFKQAATSGDASIAAAARYNLGNCFYSDAVAKADQDKQSAVDSLTQAILHYRASLRANPNHVDARANIELAVQLRKRLQDEQKQEQKQQEQQGNQQQQPQDQENQESQSQSGNSDQQQDQDAQSDDQQSSQEPSEQEQSDENSEPNKNDQSSKQEQSAETGQSERQQESDHQPANPQSPSMQDQQSAAEQASEDASAAEQSSDEQTPQESEAVPTGELKPANEQPRNDEATRGVAASGADEGLMTQEEALKMLQAVRDRDMLRRLRQEQLERSRHVPTERDW